MIRIGVGVLVGVLIAIAAFIGWREFNSHEDGITIQGDLLMAYDKMVYTEGTPGTVSREVINGCSGGGLHLGGTVRVDDAQGKEIATGRITRTLHSEGDPSSAIDRANHGCSFTYVVTGVPKLAAYDIWVGLLIGAQDVAWDSLTYFESGGKVFYLVPLIRIG